jgi:hypothetical protein
VFLPFDQQLREGVVSGNGDWIQFNSGHSRKPGKKSLNGSLDLPVRRAAKTHPK